MNNFKINQSGPLTGEITVPGDKSISHRAVMLGAIANGRTTIRDILLGEDVQRTMNAFRSCGVTVEQDGSTVLVEGKGLNGLNEPDSDIYCGNSGTSMRLLTGLFAAQKFPSRLTGDESLTTRPMLRVVEPLRRMGAEIDLSPANSAPVDVKPSDKLSAITWELPVASAQVQSAILLAGLYVSDTTTVIEPRQTRDHTINMLRHFGGCVERENGHISVRGGQSLNGQEIKVPADISSAAFFIVAATLTPGSDLTLREVGINPTRTALLDVLGSMGASIELCDVRYSGREKIADIRVRYADSLEATVVDPELIPKMIDEVPILAIAAAKARGVTVISGGAELRVKESDRIRSTAEGLQALGIEVTEKPDGMEIHGGELSGGTVDSFGDHRIAMSFAVAGGVAQSPVYVNDCDCVNTSFPGFADLANVAGMNIQPDTELECTSA